MRSWTLRPLTPLQKFSLLSFLSILVITVVVSASVATFLSRHLVKRDAEVTAEVISLLIIRTLPVSSFTQFPPDPKLYERTLEEIHAVGYTGRIILYNVEGTVLWSDEPSLIGQQLFHDNVKLRQALSGSVETQILHPGEEAHHRTLRSFDRLQEIYLPIRYPEDRTIVGVLELYRHPPALFAALDQGLAVIWVLGGGGALLLYLSLFGIVRNSSRAEEALKTELAAYTRTLEERVAARTQQLSQTASDLSTLCAISSTVNESLDIQEILDRALKQLLEAKGFDGGWIRVLSHRREGSAITASQGVCREFAQALERETEQVIRTGELLLISQKPAGGSPHEGRSRPEEFCSIALLPISLQDRPIGILGVASRNIYRFTLQEVQLLSSVALQIGIAVRNAQLYAAARERGREAQILYDMTRRLTEQTDQEALLKIIVEGAVMVTHASWGGVGFPEEEDIVLRPLFFGDPSRGSRAIRLKISESVAGLAYTSGQPQLVNDALRHPRINQQAARADGLTSVIFAPLRTGGQVTGVLFTCNKEAGPFTEHDLVLLTTFANHAGAAMDNARLQAETLRREREASILYRTSMGLHEQADPEALLTTIVQGAIEITNATFGGIGQNIGEELVIRPLVGTSLPHGDTEIRLPLTGSAAGLTYETGEPLIVNDLERSPCAAPVRAAAKAYGFRNFLCAPLKSKNTALGVIKVCNKKGDASFTDDDLRLLTTFATQAAMMLENVQLFHEIKTTKEYLENLIESSVDAIVTVNPRGLLTFVSQGAYRMFGYRPEDVLGTCVLPYVVKGEKEIEALQKLLADKGRVQNYETELYAADNRILSVNLSATLLHDATGQVTGVLAVVKDVTGLRKLQQQMIRSERLAATGLLAAGVAHEVGNPVACISSLAQVLLARVADPAIRRGLQDIQIHVGRIQGIIQDLAQLARPAPFQFRESSVNDIVQNAIAVARHNPAARKMKITMALDAALPRARVAPDQLLQVFLNLILNAAEAGGDLTIRTTPEGGQVRAVFSDTGHGISADELRRLFDPFYSTKDAERHMGLGLFVSHEIVRQHGGALLAESEPGRGSTFTIVLPAER